MPPALNAWMRYQDYERKEVKHMKRALLVVLSLLFSAALVTTVLAQEKKAPETSKPKVHHYYGTVASVDSAAKLLVVKGKKNEMKFDVADAKWKGYKGMGEVKAGEHVRVKYVEEDGTMMAQLVYKAGHRTAKKEVETAPKPAETPDKQ
jgi:membrane protein implicated in regulation of membrane protease activity